MAENQGNILVIKLGPIFQRLGASLVKSGVDKTQFKKSKVKRTNPVTQSVLPQQMPPHIDPTLVMEEDLKEDRG